MPLKELANYINSNNTIDNKELFETGRKIAQERICDFQTELSKIEYTLRYLKHNQQYSGEEGFYRRSISERTIITREYTDNITDIRRIEIESGELYNYAQSRKYSPVFPAGFLIGHRNGEQQTKIFFEIVRENIKDEYVTTIPAGEFQCCQVNLTPEIDILEQIEMTFGRDKLESANGKM